MARRRSGLYAFSASMVLAAAACGSQTAPLLTDPVAIVTAAVASAETATSVHLDVTLDGSAPVDLPIGGGTGSTFDLTGTTASADIDFARTAVKATFAVPEVFSLAGAVIAVDGVLYVRTSLSGPLYLQSPAADSPIDPGAFTGMFASLGDVLSGDGVTLVKGDDVACGAGQCYTISTDLTPQILGTDIAGTVDNLPIDLAGASLRMETRVSQTLPNRFVGITAVLTIPDSASLNIVVTASKWDQTLSITAPPADQVQGAP